MHEVLLWVIFWAPLVLVLWSLWLTGWHHVYAFLLGAAGLLALASLTGSGII